MLLFILHFFFVLSEVNIVLLNAFMAALELEMWTKRMFLLDAC